VRTRERDEQAARGARKPKPLRKSDQREAAEVLRRILDAVDRGNLIFR
jgi:hypothetical protein